MEDIKDKQLKAEMRRMKREAKDERRYGNPVMMKIAEKDPSVRSYYERYKDCNREARTQLIFSGLFMLLGVINVVWCVVSGDKDYAFSFAFDAIFAVQWLTWYELSMEKANILRHEFVQYADSKAVTKVFKELTNGSDEAEKVD